MGTDEQNHSQYMQAVENTVMKSRNQMEKSKGTIFLRPSFKVGINKKATHKWNK